MVRRLGIREGERESTGTRLACGIVRKKKKKTGDVGRKDKKAKNLQLLAARARVRCCFCRRQGRPHEFSRGD